MNTGNAMGGHQSARPITTTWLTPPEIIGELGGAASFDLDPCGFEGSPFPCARESICEPDDGLAVTWGGRVYVNPPYTTGEIGDWLAKLQRHGRGVALIFARTETEVFHRHVWQGAAGLLFLEGRLHFHYPDGEEPARCADRCARAWVSHDGKGGGMGCRWCGAAKANAGAPSVLCAYGQDDLDRLAACGLAGALTPLRFARFVAVGGVSDMSWREALIAWVRRQDGPVSVSDAYRHFARHPKAQRNPNWRAKVRQTFQRAKLANVGPGMWSEGAAA